MRWGFNSCLFAIVNAQLLSTPQISWCACRDDQSSADTQEHGESVGAMSWVRLWLQFYGNIYTDLFQNCNRHSGLLSVCISQLYHKQVINSILAQNPNQSYAQLLKSVRWDTFIMPEPFAREGSKYHNRQILRKRYSQVSQLSSSHPMVGHFSLQFARTPPMLTNRITMSASSCDRLRRDNKAFYVVIIIKVRCHSLHEL